MQILRAQSSWMHPNACSIVQTAPSHRTREKLRGRARGSNPRELRRPDLARRRSHPRSPPAPIAMVKRSAQGPASRLLRSRSSARVPAQRCARRGARAEVRAQTGAPRLQPSATWHRTNRFRQNRKGFPTCTCVCTSVAVLTAVDQDLECPDGQFRTASLSALRVSGMRSRACSTGAVEDTCIHMNV